MEKNQNKCYPLTILGDRVKTQMVTEQCETQWRDTSSRPLYSCPCFLNIVLNSVGTYMANTCNLPPLNTTKSSSLKKDNFELPLLKPKALKSSHSPYYSLGKPLGPHTSTYPVHSVLTFSLFLLLPGEPQWWTGHGSVPTALDPIPNPQILTLFFKTSTSLLKLKQTLPLKYLSMLTTSLKVKVKILKRAYILLQVKVWSHQTLLL